MKQLSRIDILRYPILNEGAEAVARRVCDDFNDGGHRSFVFLNPHTIVIARDDPALRQAVADAYGLFCDGVGLSIAARILRHRRIPRVYGYEFFIKFSEELSNRGLGKVFFLGGSGESLDELMGKYRRQFPGIRQVDGYAPPFKSDFSSEDVLEMARRIEASAASVLWVGLGSPKQEKILYELSKCCRLPCAAAVGAVFDFYTGRVPHAPRWVRNLGLQWAHRLILEPKRLWKRTLVSTPIFMWMVLKDLLRPDGSALQA